MLNKAVPVLPAVNISHTIDFYETKLGFKGINYGTYGILKYKNVEIHLALDTTGKGTGRFGCFILVDNIQDLYTKYCAMGLINLKGKLTDKPGGIKEFFVSDNNNNMIRFGENR